MFKPMSPILTECVEHIESIFTKLSEEEFDALNKSFNSSDSMKREISLPLSIALNKAIQQKTCTAIIASQNNILNTATLLISHVSTIPFEVLKYGLLADEHWSKLVSALTLLNDLPIYFKDDSTEHTDEPISIDKIIYRLKWMHNSHQLGQIVLDKLELERENQAEAVYSNEEFFVKLYQFAADFNISILDTNEVPYQKSPSFSELS